jgi:POT family proton-dependent oligopeptide transporter
MGHEKHPAGLYPLFLTEMWERFSFYLMLGILPLYLTDSQKGGMGLSDSQMAVIVGSYMALVYFTPFIGGLIADRLLGLRRTILIGGFLMMCGQFVLAMPSTPTLYMGMGLLILGNGAFKPNISSILGNLYPPGSPLKDAGYNIFYMGINIGAFICNFIAAFVRNYFDKYPLHLGSGLEIRGWHAAFSTGGFGMFLGIIIFSTFYRLLGAGETERRATPNPEARLTPLWVQCLAPAVILGAIAGYAAYFGWIPESLHLNVPTAAFLGACIPVVIFYLNIWLHVPDMADRGRVGALLFIYAVVIVFWMTFQLNSTALTIWARDDTNRTLAGPMQALTERIPQLGENAPPKYFENAGPEVPRPDQSTFVVVSPTRYKELEDKNELSFIENDKGYVHVTQEMLDKVYARATPETPSLPPGEHLKLANTELFQSINAGFVILFTPLIVAFWRKLRERGQEPSSSAKIGFGLLLTAGAPLLMLAATWISGDGAVKTSAWWLFGVYGVITLGELCLSPMGLSLVNKLAPASITAFMMGGWFLSTSVGGKLSGIFGEAYSKMNHVQFWIILIVCDLVCAGIIFATLPWLNRQMAGKGEAQKG